MPQKLLLQETGKPLIQHTYEAALKSELADEVFVATDSAEIFSVIDSIGGTAVMTSEDHKSGTDRIAEAARQVNADVVVNVQGDEPEIDCQAIDLLIETLQQNESVAIATLATPIDSETLWLDPSCVKVVLNRDGQAMYFSRSPIPSMKTLDSTSHWMGKSPDQFLQHIGIYGFRDSCLQELCQLPQIDLEQIESLEQLRFLYHGFPIQVCTVQNHASGIDTAEDYAQFVNRFNNG